MRKIAQFIIKHKVIVLSVICILTILSALMIPKVKVNQSMIDYLPSDSPVKIGTDILNSEFSELDMNGKLAVMFQGVSKEEVKNIAEQIRGMEYVSLVEYDESDKYNKSDYRLILITCTHAWNTAEELSLEENIKNTYSSYEVFVNHQDEIIMEIPLFVYGIIFIILVVLLFIMCHSYFEPILYFVNIIIAIVLNTGSNIIFGTISQTTFSMAAVLQLALSMDYSIMLMNRYTQAKESSESNSEAMITAYTKSMPSIISSAMTTAAGLMILAFMDLKIGLDLGRVMAKGVLLSLLCAMTLLPILILLTDKLIEKTRKKPFEPKMSALSNFNYEHRKKMALVFLGIFALSFYLNIKTEISFEQPSDNFVSQVFPKDNQMVLIYDSDDEAKVKEMIEQLEGKENISQILGFSNTIGKQMTSDELREQIGSMTGTDFSPLFIKLAYYRHMTTEPTEQRYTFEEMAKFINDEVLSDSMISSYLTQEDKELLQKYLPLLSSGAISAPRSISEISEFMGIEEAKVKLLFAYAYSMKADYQTASYDISSMVKFINENVLSDPTLSASLTEEMKNSFQMLANMTDKEFISIGRTSEEMANILSIDKTQVSMIYLTASTTSMSVNRFIDHVIDNILPNPMYSSMFTDEMKESLTFLKKILDLTVSAQPLTDREFAAVLTLDPSYSRLIYSMRYVYENEKDAKVSLGEILTATQSDFVSAYLTEEQKAYIKAFSGIADSLVSAAPLTKTEFSTLISGIYPAMSEEYIAVMYDMKSASAITNETISVLDFARSVDGIVNDGFLGTLVPDSMKATVKEFRNMLEENVKNFVSGEHSILVINTTLPTESKQTFEFIDEIKTLAKNSLESDFYLVGEASLNSELKQSFSQNQILISFLSALAIYLIVMITFRSLITPLILVLIVQAGVFITSSVSYIGGSSIYYLGMLVVQCILMGATVDYEIVFVNHYIELRETMTKRQAIKKALALSSHTILTSSLLIILITGAIGLSPASATISEICMTISIGALSVLMLILFVLPSLIVIFDRFIVKKNRAYTEGNPQVENNSKAER